MCYAFQLAIRDGALLLAESIPDGDRITIRCCAPELESKLRPYAADCVGIVVDLRLGLASGSFWPTILGLRKPLAIVNPDPRTAHLLDILKLRQLLVHSDQQAALTALLEGGRPTG